MPARTCLRCQRNEPHEFKHGTLHSFQYHGCRCFDCKVGARAQINKWRAANPEAQLGTHGDPEQRRAYYELNRDQFVAHHAKQIDKFSRAAGGAKRKAWTPDEDAIATRQDLSLLEIAYLLKRNRGSILYRRNALRTAAS